jgi:hypothetical protein
VSDEIRKSKYWLSPGIDVPMHHELEEMMEPRKLGRFYVDCFASEGLFIPTTELMREPPLARLDILEDIRIDVERTRTHALVECFRELQRRKRHPTIAHEIAAFRRACEHLGTEWTADFDGVLLLDQQYRLFGGH